MPGGTAGYMEAADYGTLVLRVVGRSLAGDSGDRVADGAAHRELARAYQVALDAIVALDSTTARLLTEARGKRTAPLLLLPTEEWHDRMHRSASCADHDTTAEEAEELRLTLIAAVDHAGGTVQLSPARLLEAGKAGRMVAWWYDEKADATVLTTDEEVADRAGASE